MEDNSKLHASSIAKYLSKEVFNVLPERLSQIYAHIENYIKQVSYDDKVIDVLQQAHKLCPSMNGTIIDYVIRKLLSNPFVDDRFERIMMNPVTRAAYETLIDADMSDILDIVQQDISKKVFIAVATMAIAHPLSFGEIKKECLDVLHFYESLSEDTIISIIQYLRSLFPREGYSCNRDVSNDLYIADYDLATEDTIIDIKCCNCFGIDSWIIQLMLYAMAVHRLDNTYVQYISIVNPIRHYVITIPVTNDDIDEFSSTIQPWIEQYYASNEVQGGWLLE